ncbi:MAG: hypothetical protein AAFU79_14160 [Myxococcota bacterium]
MRAWVVMVGLLAYPSVALAGDFRGQAGVDFLFAQSQDDVPTAGVPESLTAQELGMRIRFDAREFDGRLQLAVDYRGREPVGGDIQNSALRLLYQAELSFIVAKDVLTVSAGRFIAPAALLLPVDGARVAYSPSRKLHFGVFGGRRAISISRRNLDFDVFRPAVGGSVRFVDRGLQAEVAASYAEDQAVLLKGSADDSEEVTEDYGSAGVYGRVTARPVAQLLLGGQASFLEQARYIIGPQWSAVEVDVDAFNVWSGNVFADWRPLRALQLDYTFHYQEATAYRAGLRLADGAEVEEEQAPYFVDNRVRIGWRPFNRGWIRVRGRFRVRPDRQERRLGASLRADRIGIPGLYVDGRVWYDDIEFDEDAKEAPDLDRLWWSAALGFRNFGLDASVGVRLIDRFAGPVSGRAFNPGQAGQPADVVDLQPFTLETQRIAFLRAFYAQKVFFAGVDAELNVEDAEMRFMVQAGTFLEAAW